MGQYWLPVNLDKHEYVMPHKLGTGLKLWEQLANSPGTGAALIVLTAAMPEQRGGGDFDLDRNWHGPERTMDKYPADPAPMPEDYHAVAARTIGRWAGDRIAIVGDYAEDGDLAPEHVASTIYSRCNSPEDVAKYGLPEGVTEADLYTDISADVARVIEHELNGRYEGTGWRHWKEGTEA